MTRTAPTTRPATCKPGRTGSRGSTGSCCRFCSNWCVVLAGRVSLPPRGRQSANGRNKDEVLAHAKPGQTIAAPRDVVNDPFVLEFHDVKERSAWLEREREVAESTLRLSAAEPDDGNL